MFKCLNNKGFTLIEAITAIFVLTVGIVSVFSVITQHIVSSRLAAHKLTAAYLAQEGIEIVRNIKDTNLVKMSQGESANWNDNLLNCSGGCYNFDYRSQTLPDDSYCNGKSYLKLDGNFYQCTASPDSLNWQRKVTINESGDILEVRVEVTWQERGVSQSLTAQTNFYNYYTPSLPPVD